MMCMKLIFAVFVFFAGLYSCNAVQCHQCKFENFTSIYQGQFGCMDPFRSPGIEQVECDGQCYANLTKITDESFTLETVHRGCSTGSGITCEHFQGCQELPGTHICLYCCNDADGCNSRSFEEVDQSVSKCYQCQANLTADGFPADNSTCGRSDFDGTGDIGTGDLVYALPCSSGTCITFTSPANADVQTPPSITRTCAVEGLLDFCAAPDAFEDALGYQIDCCNGDLCNVGSDVAAPGTDGTPVTSAPDVTERNTITCWHCAGNLTNDGLPTKDSTCGSPNFDGSGEDVFPLPCPSGVCITLVSPVNDVRTLPSVTRTCAVDVLLDFCESPLYHETFFGYQNIECCNEDRCITEVGFHSTTTEIVTTRVTTGGSMTSDGRDTTERQETTPQPKTTEAQNMSTTKKSQPQATQVVDTTTSDAAKVKLEYMLYLTILLLGYIVTK